LRLWELDDVEDVFVFPHMGDGGLALGAALWRSAALDGPRRFSLGDLRLGPEVRDEDVEASLREAGLAFQKPSSVEREAAKRLARGEVLFWYQGRMEYGPRALGGRSILSRPDRTDIRDRLNLRIKRRVWYQPFCPSILDEESPRLLENGGARLDRYMTMAYRASPEGRRWLAAVIGPDGTCRPQMVGPDGGRFRRLLEEFREAAGVGALLNTSFNLHGEPIVATPADALRTFAASGADAMAMGDFIVTGGEGRRGEP
jgi:carbamoyltransferase